MSTQTEENVIVSNGRSFRRTTWNGISVVQEVESGYYSANNVCRENRKHFEKISSKKYWQDYIEALSVRLTTRRSTRPPQTRSALLLRASFEITDVQNDFRGTYIHPYALHFLCEHVNYEYAIKVSELLDLLNERNQLTHQTLEQTIEALKSKIESKNHVLNELEAELISRADIIDEQNIVIEHKDAIIDEYNKPFNQIDGTPSIYALPKDSSHFQLRIDPFGFGTNGIRNVKLINASFIRNEVIKVLKSESLVTSINREYWIPMNKLDYAFNLINEIKDNRRTEILTPEERNEFIDKKLETFRAGRKSTQTDGLIFEYETIKSNSSYIPWKLIPKTILNTYGERRKDRGIDAVEIENNEISKIIQIKKHNGGYLRRDELQTFLSKCSQERYSHASKLLIVKNAKISNKLHRELAAISIEVVSVQ